MSDRVLSLSRVVGILDGGGGSSGIRIGQSEQTARGILEAKTRGTISRHKLEAEPRRVRTLCSDRVTMKQR